jgi:hypothetical protein
MSFGVKGLNSTVQQHRVIARDGTSHPVKFIVTIIFIYLFLTAIGLTPCGSITVYIYTQTVHRIQRTEHTYQKGKKNWEVQAVPRLCDLYPGICLTTEEKAQTTLS